MANWAFTSRDVQSQLNEMNERIAFLQRQNEALHSQIQSTVSIAANSRTPYQHHTGGLNRHLDIGNQTHNQTSAPVGHTLVTDNLPPPPSRTNNLYLPPQTPT